MSNLSVHEVSIGNNASSLQFIGSNEEAMLLKFARGAPIELNSMLVDALIGSYNKYLRLVSNPCINVKTVRSSNDTSFSDYTDDNNLCYIYQSDTGIEVVKVRLFSGVNSSINSNLIQEIKCAYIKYMKSLKNRYKSKKK